MAVEVRPYAFAQARGAPGLQALLAQYADESAIPELGPASPQWRAYERMEAAGVARLLCVFWRGELVGFAVVILSEPPHYGQLMAVTESLFVAPQARKSGAGLALLRAVEQLARDAGARGLFVSAPSGGRLQEVMQRHKAYRESNRVFFRILT